MLKRSIGVLVFAIGLLFALSVFAQDDTESTSFSFIEFSGVFEVVDENTLLVAGIQVDMSLAEIALPQDPTMPVKVEGVLLEDGTVLAAEVETDNGDAMDDNSMNASNDDSNGYEIVGVLEGFDGTTFIVSGRRVDVSDAEVSGVLEIGGVVKIEATPVSDGIWSASEIKEVEGDDDEYRLVGTIEQVGDGFIVVNGQNFQLNNQTSETEFLIGEPVDLTLRFDEETDGAFVASEVVRIAAPQAVSDDRSGGSCGAPDGWTSYTVQSGDTVSGIAARTGSSTNALSDANCLDDDSFIASGQTFSVPRTPDPRPANVLTDDDDDGFDNDDMDDDDSFDNDDMDDDDSFDNDDMDDDSDNADDDADDNDDDNDDDNADDNDNDDNDNDDNADSDDSDDNADDEDESEDEDDDDEEEDEDD